MSTSPPTDTAALTQAVGLLSALKQCLRSPPQGGSKSAEAIPQMQLLVEQLQQALQDLSDPRLSFAIARLKSTARVALTRRIALQGPLRALDEIARRLESHHGVPLASVSDELPPEAVQDASPPLASPSSSRSLSFERVTSTPNATQPPSLDQLAHDLGQLPPPQEIDARQRLISQALDPHDDDLHTREDLDFPNIDHLGLFSVEDDAIDDSVFAHDDNVFTDFDTSDNEALNAAAAGLLPAANEVSFEDSGLLMIFAPDVSAQEDIGLDISVEPVQVMSDAERAVDELVSRLRRILIRLLDSLDLVLIERQPGELVDIARQLNRIARVIGLFQLDEHLAMIAHIQNRLPVTTEPWDGNYHNGSLPRLVDDARLDVFQTEQEEVLSCIVALFSRLVEDIPQLDRERYERAFLTLYDSLGWEPRSPGPNSPTREGWSLMTELQALIQQVTDLLDETLIGISATLNDGHQDGYRYASANLMQIAEIMAQHCIPDVMLPLARLSAFLRHLRPIDSPVDRLIELLDELWEALRPWFRDLPIHRFQQHVHRIHQQFLRRQQSRTGQHPRPAFDPPDESLPSEDSDHQIPLGQPVFEHVIDLPEELTSDEFDVEDLDDDEAARPRASQYQAHPTAPKRSGPSTGKVPSGMIQLIAQLDSLIKRFSEALDRDDFDALLSQPGVLLKTTQLARRHGLHALATALEVLTALIDTCQQPPSLEDQRSVTLALSHLGQIAAFAIEHIEHLEHPSAPLRSGEAYFLIESSRSSSARHLFLFHLHREVSSAFAALQSTTLALSRADHTRPTLIERYWHWIERLEHLTRYAGLQAPLGALAEHREAFSAIDAMDEGLAQGLSTLEQRFHDALPATLPPFEPAFSQRLSAFALATQRGLLRLKHAIDDLASQDPPGFIAPQHPLLNDLVDELLTLALPTRYPPFIAAVCLLRAGTVSLDEVALDPTQQRLLIERGRYWLERVVSLAITRGVRLDDSTARSEPLSQHQVTAHWPLSALHLEDTPGSTSTPNFTLGASSPLKKTLPDGQVSLKAEYLEAAALTHLAQRLQSRARILSKPVEVSTQSLPRPLLSGDDRVLVFSLMALESIADDLCSAIIDHGWWERIDDPPQLRLTLRADAEQLSVQIEHNSRPLDATLLRRCLQIAGIGVDPHFGPNALLEVLCRHPGATQQLIEGPALAVAVAQLHALGGALSLESAAPFTRLIASIPRAPVSADSPSS